jgi:hypothetical protein
MSGEPLERIASLHALGGELQAQRLAGVRQSFPRYRREGGVVLHQAALPGVFQLLRPPQLGKLRAPAGKEALAALEHAVHVVQRAVGVKDQGIVAHVN